MKSAVVFALLVGVAVAQLDTFNSLGAGTGAANGAGAGGGAAFGGAGAGNGAAAAPGAATNRGNPWGPRAYGMGLNNPWAMPVNPFQMRSALALIQNIPNTLVRVDVDGEVTITNQFGQEVDVLDGFGQDLTDIYDF